MNILRNFYLIILLYFVFSCNDKEFSYDSNLDKIETSNYYFGQKLEIDVKEKNHKINSYKISINDKELESNKIILDSTNVHFGTNFLTININYEDNQTFTIDREFSVYSSIKEQNKTYEVISEIPHDQNIFTQGFELKNGFLYESAGQNGQSKVIKRSLENINPIQTFKNSDEVFGEGLTILNNKVYQLSWQNNKAFLLNNDLKLEKELPYPRELKEGWGICNDGKNLFVSSEQNNPNIVILNEKFEYINKITITGNQKLYTKMNELEYANNKIYSNIWQENNIISINPKTGQVLEIYDFSELVAKNKTSQEDVLNGIAHISENIFLITGKNWKNIYKVKLN